jgi:hypothetical protein
MQTGLCGDFNAIRSAEERKIRVSGPRYDDFTNFNQFIDNNVLFDLPLCGRRYT